VSVTTTPASEADLDSIAWALGEERNRTGAWLRWRLIGPAGTGVVVRGVESLALLAPLRLIDGTMAWQQVDALGDVDALDAAIEDVVGDDLRLALGPRPLGEGWQRAADLPAWVTGPDPFEPLQHRVMEADPRHDALAERLASGGRAVVETWSGIPRRHGPRWAPSRGADWLDWRTAEADDLVLMEVSDGPEVGPNAHCRGWILLREGEAHGVRTLRVLDLQAQDRDAHYALLKAGRQLSWQRGGIPVVLHGERMSRRYALSAGFVPATRPLVRERLSVWTHGRPPAGTWRAWTADV